MINDREGNPIKIGYSVRVYGRGMEFGYGRVLDMRDDKFGGTFLVGMRTNGYDVWVSHHAIEYTSRIPYLVTWKRAPRARKIERGYVYARSDEQAIESAARLVLYSTGEPGGVVVSVERK